MLIHLTSSPAKVNRAVERLLRKGGRERRANPHVFLLFLAQKKERKKTKWRGGKKRLVVHSINSITEKEGRKRIFKIGKS